jgi:hypothetical protein
MRRLIHPFKDNSLSIILFALFAICIPAQTFAGWRLQNETLAAHGQAPVGYWHNLATGTFMEGLATNWQAVVVGDKAYNETRTLGAQRPISIAAFLLWAKFWSSTLQTRQAEYLAVSVFIVLSILLRQQESAESKPLESGTKPTGEAQ